TSRRTITSTSSFTKDRPSASTCPTRWNCGSWRRSRASRATPPPARPSRPRWRRAWWCRCRCSSTRATSSKSTPAPASICPAPDAAIGRRSRGNYQRAQTGEECWSMATVREKIAYLRGLLEGTDLAGNGPQARVVWEKILEILDAVADRLDELELGQEEIEEYLEAIDADLADLEEEVLGDDFDDDDDDVDEEDVGASCVEMQWHESGQRVYIVEHFLLRGLVVACPTCGQLKYFLTGVESNEEAHGREEDEHAERDGGHAGEAGAPQA